LSCSSLGVEALTFNQFPAPSPRRGRLGRGAQGGGRFSWRLAPLVSGGGPFSAVPQRPYMLCCTCQSRRSARAP